jgi:hypothetical protein
MIMNDKKSLPLKRHETFSIREGWLEKAINEFSINANCFSKDKGQRVLGIGTNMVKSLRYWCTATQLIRFSQFRGNTFNELGNFLLSNDRYLEQDYSWWLIHLYLCSNFEDAPVFNTFFNLNVNRFEKEQLVGYIRNVLEVNYDLGAPSSLEADVNMIIKSYYSDDKSNPENNLTCPLSKLGLLEMIDKKTYARKQPKYNSLDYRVIYHALTNVLYKDESINSFNIEDMYELPNNPLNIFNLSKSSLYQYLEEMKKKGLINLVKTAGLNIATFEKRLSLQELFQN